MRSELNFTPENRGGNRETEEEGGGGGGGGGGRGGGGGGGCGESERTPVNIVDKGSFRYTGFQYTL